jgi:hypothetical protein
LAIGFWPLASAWARLTCSSPDECGQGKQILMAKAAAGAGGAAGTKGKKKVFKKKERKNVPHGICFIQASLIPKSYCLGLLS